MGRTGFLFGFSFTNLIKFKTMKKKWEEGPEAFRNGPAQQSPLCDSTTR